MRLGLGHCVCSGRAAYVILVSPSLAYGFYGSGNRTAPDVQTRPARRNLSPVVALRRYV